MTWGDADGQLHEVLEHEDGEVRVAESLPAHAAGAQVAPLPLIHSK